ncbi:ABC transporter ATP-binding protein [Lysinibacter sp. HNR]|uniref:ABC transporter ATP-binding protein n=1 Tax=Lysinibacter sp. HNR TaxID=3031408 RepID=UPI002435A009|nr:ABC transporter ATP-binding protein [Lysinibacter sp. HNR]WGD36255.1 ABC transporter ATP-binding protein [Lysinibacter sp. HNR]
MNTLIELKDVSRVYGSPPTTALDKVSLLINEGELTAVVGPSGSGKSTLLNIIGTLDRPSTGTARIAGQDVSQLTDSKLSALRAHTIGFVFQQFHLSEGVNALNNVAMGLLYTGVPARERRARAEVALQRVGLEARMLHRPNQLSGGERQRVAIARALVGEPPLLLADEPTGNLDTVSGTGVMNLLTELNLSGTTIVVITHDTELAKNMPRQIVMRDGQQIADRRREPQK